MISKTYLTWQYINTMNRVHIALMNQSCLLILQHGRCQARKDSMHMLCIQCKALGNLQ
jgi:hypothetical protein